MADEENRSTVVPDWLSNAASKGTLSPAALPSSPEAEKSTTEEQVSDIVVAERSTERAGARPRRDEHERRRGNGATRRGGGGGGGSSSSTYRPNYDLPPEPRRDTERQPRGCSPRAVETSRRQHVRTRGPRTPVNSMGSPDIYYDWERRPGSCQWQSRSFPAPQHQHYHQRSSRGVPREYYEDEEIFAYPCQYEYPRLSLPHNYEASDRRSQPELDYYAYNDLGRDYLPGRQIREPYTTSQDLWESPPTRPHYPQPVQGNALTPLAAHPPLADYRDRRKEYHLRTSEYVQESGHQHSQVGGMRSHGIDDRVYLNRDPSDHLPRPRRPPPHH